MPLRTASTPRRHGPLAGLKGQVVDEDAEQLLVPDRHSLDRLGVDPHESPQALGVHLGEPGQIGADCLGKFSPRLLQLPVLIEILPGGGGAQAAGVEEAPEEEGPGRQGGYRPCLGEEHLLETRCEVPFSHRWIGRVKTAHRATPLIRGAWMGMASKNSWPRGTATPKGQEPAAADAGKVGRDAVEPLQVAVQIDRNRQGRP